MFAKLQQLAIGNGWGFEYSRQDYQNLYKDIEDNKIYLFVDPIATETKFTQLGNPIENIHSGKMMLLVSSDVDETYEMKYENHIKPLFSEVSDKVVYTFKCSDFTILAFKQLEVVNLFDQNLDGLVITYSLSESL